MNSPHWETHLYTFAVALTQGAAIKPENLKGMRAKAIRKGHTEGECQIVEADPLAYVRDGFKQIGTLGKAITMRRIMDAGTEPDEAHRAVARTFRPLEIARMNRTGRA